MLNDEVLPRVLAALGGVLAARRLKFEVVVIGGSSLLLHRVSIRSTRDVDVLALVVGEQLVGAAPLPTALREAAGDVGLLYGLGEAWLNPGPTAQLVSGLPPGFRDRIVRQEYDGLVVHLAGRLDLVCLKLYAAADAWPRSSKHLDDLRRLVPATEELSFAAGWVRGQDPSEPFQRLLDDLLASLGGTDGA